jgi:hypothetical protein
MDDDRDGFRAFRARPLPTAEEMRSVSAEIAEREKDYPAFTRIVMHLPGLCHALFAPETDLEQRA